MLIRDQIVKRLKAAYKMLPTTCHPDWSIDIDGKSNRELCLWMWRVEEIASTVTFASLRKRHQAEAIACVVSLPAEKLTE